MAEANLTRGDAAGEGERRPGFRAAGAVSARLVGPVVARHGGGLTGRLKAEWAAIVGPELAAATWPDSLHRGGTLRLRVAPAKALEVQHRAPLVVERVNLFFGREAVTRVALVQAALPLSPPRMRRAAPVLNPAAAAALGRQLDAVRSEALREALARLGRYVLADVDG